jgi:hypothetical protein
VREVRLNPEKITHPFQLMAAWFAMLIILVGILLAAAARISNPSWIAGFLVISSVALSILVMAAVFLMLTRFRPHLQGAREYAEWIKDERRFRGRVVKTLEIREVRDTPVGLSASEAIEVTKPQLFGSIARHRVDISSIERADDVLGALRRLGFQADIYRSELQEFQPEGYESKSQHAAIWVGSRVPPRVAILAIKTVVRIWPHLRYVHLSGDGPEETPDYVHDQMYFGGATSTARGYDLQRWTAEEIEAIPDDPSSGKFHELIRAKYGRTPSDHTADH